MSATNLMYKNIHFDSDEEIFMAMWFEELLQNGCVVDWRKNIRPMVITKGLKMDYKKVITLKTKTKIEDRQKTLLKPSEYTPDFRVYFTQKGFDKLASFIQIADFRADALFFANNDGIQDPEKVMFVFETKPSFDMQNMERLFVNNQKFIWDKYQIFVNLVEPLELFKKTFLPLAAAQYFRYKKIPAKAAAKGKKVGDFKFDWTPLTIEQYLDKEQ